VAYPVKVFIYRWKGATTCQIACRPDALSELCADILLLDDSFAVRVGGVETVEKEVLSFLLTIHVEPRFKARFEEVVDKYRTAK
jgi:ABC-type uncharacterized transport system ATPase subunit